MASVSEDLPAELLRLREPPCLTLYQPTSRHRPDNEQDPIRFRNLVKTLEASLRDTCPAQDAQALLAPFHALADDPDFWNHTLDGLAVMGAAGFFRVLRLQRPVDEFANVADSFHVKPLVRIFQSADRYQVLGLDMKHVRMFEGNRYTLAEIELAPGVPRTITDALGDELTEPHRTVASYGSGAGGAAMNHGHGGKKDETETDAERFFRAVDRAVLEHHSRPSGLPLLLAALPEHHGLFGRVSHNPHLMDGGVDVHPAALELDELRERAWAAVEPRFDARLVELREAYGTARARDLAAEDPAEIARSAVAGRIATLLVEDNRCIPGRIDPATGAVEPGDLARPGVDDLLDDLGEMVLRAGGELVVVPPDSMPTATGAAAIYRY